MLWRGSSYAKGFFSEDSYSISEIGSRDLFSHFKRGTRPSQRRAVIRSTEANRKNIMMLISCTSACGTSRKMARAPGTPHVWHPPWPVRREPALRCEASPHMFFLQHQPGDGSESKAGPPTQGQYSRGCNPGTSSHESHNSVDNLASQEHLHKVGELVTDTTSHMIHRGSSVTESIRPALRAAGLQSWR